MAIRSTRDWVDGLRPQVTTLDNEELAERMRTDPDLVIIDIRELQERIERGAIPGAHHVPRGMLEFWADPAMGYYRDFFREDKSYVIYCAGGGRSVLASLALKEMGYRRVAHLGGGFDGWKAAGLPIDDISATSKWVRRGKAG